MTERIGSPQQLNNTMKVSRMKVWIILAVLTVTVIGGLGWFFTREIVMREHHPCYVTGVSMRKDEALYEIYKANFGVDIDFTIDTIREDYGERVNSSAQIAYLIVDDLEMSEIIEGMKVNVNGKTASVALLPAVRSEYDAMAELGIRDEEMRAAGLNPGLSYYLCEIFIDTADGELVLDPGFYPADVELDRIDPVNFILKQGG